MASVRLKRALSDAEPAGRPLRSITQPDLDLATDESDAEEHREAAEEETAELSDSMETPLTPSRMTRSRSRSVKREVVQSARQKLGSGGANLRAPSPAQAAAIPSAISASRSTPPRHPNRAGSAKKKPGVVSPTSASASSENPSPLPPTPNKRGGGSNKKKELAPSLRKGSDARREQTAAQIRAETARLEALFVEAESRKKALAEEERQRKRRKRTSGRVWGVLAAAVLLPVVFALGWITLAGDSTTLPYSGLLGAISSQFAAAFDSFAGSSQGESFSTALARLHARLEGDLHLQPRQISTIENALLAHEESYRTAMQEARSNGGGGDAGEAQWNSASVGLFQPPKPLVLVLLTSSDSTPPSLVSDIVDHLATELAEGAGVVQFSRRPEWTRQGAIEFLRDRLAHPTSSKRAQPSLARGVVHIPAAHALPRSVAEVFHRYADDVSAPFRDVAYVFHIDAGTTSNSRDSAEDVVEEILKRSWRLEQQGADEVIQPLLSRVIRNVVDLR